MEGTRSQHQKQNQLPGLPSFSPVDVFNASGATCVCLQLVEGTGRCQHQGQTAILPGLLLDVFHASGGAFSAKG